MASDKLVVDQKEEMPSSKDMIKVIKKSHVKPNKKLGRRECQLVTFDLPYIAFYYNQKLLVYKGSDYEGMVEKLKEGLGVVLEDFYQLAGKLAKDEEWVFRVECDDDMEGVEVVEADAEWLGVQDLTIEEGTSTFKHLIPYFGILNSEGLSRPLLSVQLTKLKDGLAMGCAFNHAILDGTSTWHFMSSWAEICRGSSCISIPPFLERTKVRNTRVKLDLSSSSVDAAAANGTNTANGNEPSPQQLRERVFKFSEAAIDKIKSTVNATSLPIDHNGDDEQQQPPKPFSTFQSLSVHIWRYVTLARQLNPEDYTVFTVFADCRKRVDPPMPESYFGNLIQAIFTVTAAGLLSQKPPQFGASLIQKAIEAHDAKAIEERNKQFESAPKIFQFKDAGVNCVAVGSSPRFPVYEVDFGWGKPESVRSGSNNRFDGMVYLYQGKSGGRSIDVEISLDAAAMDRLEMDKAFLLQEDY
ncbi:hypothetical protein Tsubulata_024642 [Turnera subulata]|uniref:BAHD acyltransferase DCR n=1 Tax=Turnera subulata TaxID=218843 RepID=A0A9Q0JEE0_9ROSI|nr:hypothetical protein Tsubulata_024642 [Turnera subulata]